MQQLISGWHTWKVIHPLQHRDTMPVSQVAVYASRQRRSCLWSERTAGAVQRACATAHVVPCVTQATLLQCCSRAGFQVSKSCVHRHPRRHQQRHRLGAACQSRDVERRDVSREGFQGVKGRVRQQEAHLLEGSGALQVTPDEGPKEGGQAGLAAWGHSDFEITKHSREGKSRVGSIIGVSAEVRAPAPHCCCNDPTNSLPGKGLMLLKLPPDPALIQLARNSAALDLLGAKLTSYQLTWLATPFAEGAVGVSVNDCSCGACEGGVAAVPPRRRRSVSCSRRMVNAFGRRPRLPPTRSSTRPILGSPCHSPPCPCSGCCPSSLEWARAALEPSRHTASTTGRRQAPPAVPAAGPVGSSGSS